MKCKTVRTRLAAYLDDAITKAARAEERVQIREHLEVCAHCRMELERYRRLAVLLSRAPKFFSTTFSARSLFLRPEDFSPPFLSSRSFCN